MNNKKWLGNLFRVFFYVSLFITVITFSLDVVINNQGYFQKEYEKYNVSEITSISSDDLIYVTENMVDYLLGKRADLDNIDVEVNGKEREFFNDREKAHMHDVKIIFSKGIVLRNISYGIVIVGAILAWVKRNNIRAYLVNLRRVIIGVVAILAAIAGIISTNFSYYFIKFHHIFFDNDLWLLDPKTDLLINIVPEGFFVDTCVAIVVLTLLILGVIICLTYLAQYLIKKKS